MNDSLPPVRPTRGERTRALLGAVCDSLETVESCAAELAGSTQELLHHAERTRAELGPIHANAERAAVLLDRQATEIGKLRTAVAEVSYELGELKTLMRAQHSETLALFAQLGARVKTQAELMAAQSPARRHPAAER